MTRRELVKWLYDNNCEPKPITGINVTASQIQFVNKTHPNRYAYLDTPINNKELPPHVVERISILLGIPLPKDY